jgi:hypothetical protein
MSQADAISDRVGAISLVPDAETGFIDLSVDFLAAPDVQVKPSRLPPQQAVEALSTFCRTESSGSTDSFYRVGSADFSDGTGARPPPPATLPQAIDDGELSEQDKEEAVSQLTSMGFQRDVAKGVLEAVSYNLDTASQLLLEDTELARAVFSPAIAAPPWIPPPVPPPVPVEEPAPTVVKQSEHQPFQRADSTANVVVDADALIELCGMGFPDDMVRNVLKMTNNDVAQATEMLLG